MGYPYLIGARGWTMDHREVKYALGLQPSTDTDMRIPPDVSVPWTSIGEVAVMYMTSAAARAFWRKPGTNTPMRALAECPECGRRVAASRINQHARVHHAGERRGY